MRNFFYIPALALSFILISAGLASAYLTVTPSTGPVGGGNVVIISGFTDLKEVEEGVTVQFDENSATNINLSSDGTRLSMIAPAHPAGTVDITVWHLGLETSYIIESAYTYSADLPSTGTAVITQASGGSYVTNTLSVTFPQGAVTGTVFFEYSHIQVPENPAPEGMEFGGNSFSLDVYADGTSLADYGFNNPVTTTVSFDESTVESNNVDESTLALYYWSSSQGAWANDGIATVARDSYNNVITSTITHLTDFSLIGSVSAGNGQDNGDVNGGDSQEGRDGTCFVSTLF